MPTFTEPQRIALKTFILADPTLGPLANSGNYDALANALNANASPNFTVWKKPLSYKTFFAAVDWQDVGTLTTANTNRLNAIAAGADLLDPARSDNRQVFADIFSSTTITKALVGTLGQVNTGSFWKRFARLWEKILATGTGTDASPATLSSAQEGTIGAGDMGGILS